MKCRIVDATRQVNVGSDGGERMGNRGKGRAVLPVTSRGLPLVG